MTNANSTATKEQPVRNAVKTFKGNPIALLMSGTLLHAFNDFDNPKAGESKGSFVLLTCDFVFKTSFGDPDNVRRFYDWLFAVDGEWTLTGNSPRATIEKLVLTAGATGAHTVHAETEALRGLFTHVAKQKKSGDIIRMAMVLERVTDKAEGKLSLAFQIGNHTLRSSNVPNRVRVELMNAFA